MKSTVTPATPSFQTVRNKIARSMLGRAVGVLADGGAVAHGIVTSVQFGAGGPRLWVDGKTYRTEQVLTALPALFN
jgi:hypothetical protein